MNACSDYLALLLAAPGQLVSVSWLARDPWLNPAAGRARHVHANGGTVEDVLPLRPDLVLAGTTTTRQTVQLLARVGIRVVDVPYVTDLAGVTRSVRLVGAALGREAAAEALLAELARRLARSAGAAATPPRDAVVYAAGGNVDRGGTLADAIVTHTGHRNIGSVITGPGGTLGVEELLFARPHVVVLSPSRDARPSLADLTLSHPALAALPPPARVTVPPLWWACEGPAIADAADVLAAARAR
jgi:iron complex transport system substrate-binding protein